MANLRQNDGYALLAVLWISLGISALAFAVSLDARAAAATGRNRIALAASAWAAAGCEAAVREAAAARLSEALQQGAAAARAKWNTLDQFIATPNALPGPACETTWRPLGARFPINSPDLGAIARFLRYAGVPPERADSLTTAIETRRRAANRPFLHLGELRLVPGFGSGLDTLFEVETAPTSLFHALPALLATLPGFSLEIVNRLAEIRVEPSPLSSFLELAERLSPEARARFDAASPELVSTVVLQTAGWLVQVRAHGGQPRVTTVLELRFGLGGTGLILEGRRTWVE